MWRLGRLLAAHGPARLAAWVCLVRAEGQAVERRRRRAPAAAAHRCGTLSNPPLPCLPPAPAGSTGTAVAGTSAGMWSATQVGAAPLPACCLHMGRPDPAHGARPARGPCPCLAALVPARQTSTHACKRVTSPVASFPACPADEHYIPTLLSVRGLENETYCKGYGLAATNWSSGGAHPRAWR